MADVRIAGAGLTRFGKLDATLPQLAAEAGTLALGGARPDLLLVAGMAPEAFTGQGNLAVAVADALGLSGTPAFRVETGPSSGAAALQLGCMAIAAGRAERVLAVGAERMTALRGEEATRAVAALTAPEERALGLTMPALCAMMARSALHAGRWSREDLARASVEAHRWAARNPRAHLRKEITVEDVLSSPVVADPLRVLDCAPMSDGAAAVLLRRGAGPVRVAGLGHATDRLSLASRGPGALTGFAATRAAGAQALGEAGWRAGQVQVAEVHDAFSITALCSVEDLGLCGPGEAPRVWAGEQGPALNRGGGLKARGHPVGATGLAQAAEAWEQLTGAAGPRQVDGARRALVHTIGGLGNNVLVAALEAA